MDMDMHHGHAPWACTYRINMDMGIYMDIDYYWTGALCCNYAKVCNYVYNGIVITHYYKLYSPLAKLHLK
jgi:hypothetical protein